MKKSLKTLALMALVVLLAFAAVSLAEQPGRLEVLARNVEWSYLDDGKDLGAGWAAAPDTAAWKKGPAPLGFGDDVSETDPTLPLATEVGFGPDEDNKHMTTYMVTSFDAPSLEGYLGLEVYVHVDDGAVVYLNGEELFRAGIAEGDVDYNTKAKFKPKEETFVIALEDIKGLKEGANLLAAEVHQDGGDSSDLWFEMGLVAVKEIPTPIDWTKTALPNPDVEAGDVSRLVMSYNGDPSTRMGFTWYTNQATVGTDLQVMPYVEGVEEDDLDFSAAQAFVGSFTGSTNAPEYLVHKAVAEGLQPGQKYYFRVGDAASDLWSDPGSFTTDNKDNNFTFINLADSQAKSYEEAQLSADTFEIASKTVADAEFMMINGDVVDTGMKEEEWGWVLDEADDTLYNLPFMAAAGNHDEDNQSFYEHFNLTVPQGSSTSTGAYYSYDYGNTHFIVLNTNEDSAEYANFTPRQIAWLKADSAAAAARNVDWQIVVMHKGPYTTSNHATDTDILGENGVRTLVAPIFAELGIDLVLQGHDHIYALSKPINANNEAQEPTIVTEDFGGTAIDYVQAPQGVIYMIPNTAGPKVYYRNKTITDTDANYYDKFISAEEHPAAKYATDADEGRPPRSIIQNFVGIHVAADRISAIVYEIDRNVGDTPYVVDTFGILKK